MHTRKENCKANEKIFVVEEQKPWFLQDQGNSKSKESSQNKKKQKQTKQKNQRLNPKEALFSLLERTLYSLLLVLGFPPPPPLFYCLMLFFLRVSLLRRELFSLEFSLGLFSLEFSLNQFIVFDDLSKILLK
jgi:hypothetical protein